MNFFEQQHQARRQTKKLVMLFVLAVISIIVMVNLIAALIWTWSTAQGMSVHHSYPKWFFLTNTLVTVGLIGGGTLLEIFNLRDGGDAVAAMAGGRLIAPSTRDEQERRLLNVVEEMALASGIACPRVYLMDKEESINAFAAGYNQNEAIVAVTRGTITRLNRDELQGVVGHEFSHILNGDMRMNVRLIGMLFGIQMLAGFGQQLLNFGTQMRSSRSRDDKGPSAQVLLLAMGVSLLVIGSVGVFFGRLIKSAVSRQREFLADASAVQFTRNPDGIGNALRKIGGLTRQGDATAEIQHANAEHLSHFFLSAIKPSLLSGMFATHPPIGDRLRRIFGRNVELMNAPEIIEVAEVSPILPDLPYVTSGFSEGIPPSAATTSSVATSATIVAATLPLTGQSTVAAKIGLPPELDNAVRDSLAARAVVYALLLGSGAERDAQLAILDSEVPPQSKLAIYLSASIAALPPRIRLPLLDLAMPALKQLPPSERATLLENVNRLIAADNKVSLEEFALQTILTRRLDPLAGRATKVKYDDLAPLQKQVAILLSLVAYVAAPKINEAPLAAFMRGASRLPGLTLSPASLLDSHAIGFEQVKLALDTTNQLAPLAKPALIKALLAVTGEASAIPLEVADLLRSICAGLDAPFPPAIAVVYSEFGWQESQ